MRSFVVLVTLTIAVAPAARSQDLAATCSAVSDVRVGHWASYRITGDTLSRLAGLRQAVFSTEEIDGVEYLWYERFLTTVDDSSLVQQVLVPGYPFETAQTAAMIVKQGTAPAVRLPDEVLAMLRTQPSQPAPGTLAGCADLEVVGWEEVTVSAGSLRALHLKAAWGSDLWIAPNVPFGLVRAEEDAVVFELDGFGEDAQSSITETPTVGLPGARPAGQ